MGIDRWLPYEDWELEALRRSPARSPSRITPEDRELKRHRREFEITALDGIISEDPESGEGGTDDAFEYAFTLAHGQPEKLTCFRGGLAVRFALGLCS